MFMQFLGLSKSKALYKAIYIHSAKKTCNVLFDIHIIASDEDNLELYQMLEPSMVPPIIKVALQPADKKGLFICTTCLFLILCA